MSFDPRSLERLKKLGRELPQSLPAPEEKTSAPPRASERRHKVETEDNPQVLFHELMNVSDDGHVTEHLMDRLRQAEAKAETERIPIQRSSITLVNKESAAWKGQNCAKRC